jgi:hypothetical protein
MGTTQLPGETAAEIRAWCLGVRSDYSPDPALFRQQVRPLPSRAALTKLLDTAFFASTHHEGGVPLRFTLSFAPRRSCIGEALTPFAEEEPLSVRALRKLAPSCDHWNTTLLVRDDHGELVIWGSCATRMPGLFTIRITDPGVLHVLKQRPGRSGRQVEWITIPPVASRPRPRGEGRPRFGRIARFRSLRVERRCG